MSPATTRTRTPQSRSPSDLPLALNRSLIARAYRLSQPRTSLPGGRKRGMCGITGWVDFGRDLRSERAAIEAMTATMAPRGPDAGGIWISAHAALGHRRLSVIDLPCGAQPMSAPDSGDVALTFSGEIYNFTELRSELIVTRALVPHPVRHRGAAAQLPAVGSRLRGSPERHVRVRALGRAAAGAAARPRPARRQAAVLRGAAGRGAVRLRTEGDPRAPRVPRRDRRRRARGTVQPDRHEDAGARHLPGAA